MKPLNTLVTIVLIAVMSGCSIFNRGCRGDDCDVPRLLDSKPVQQYWYCYGDNQQKWTCKEDPDTALIQPIRPEPR